jgi:putative ABC transport system permease protein
MGQRNNMFERLRFYTRHSVNDLRVNGRRTVFALLCIAAGVAAIVSLQTLAVMMNNALTGSLQETNRGDLRVNPSNRWANYVINPEEETFDGTYVFTPEGVAHVQEWLDTNYPGSELTYRQAVKGFGVAWSASIPARDTYKAFIYNFIIDAQEYPLYGTVKAENGKRLVDLLQAPTDIVISRNLADDLEAQVGDQLRLPGASQDFTVRGIVPTDTEGGFLNFAAHIFGYFYLDQSSTTLFQDLTPGEATTLFIRLKNPDQVDAAAKKLDRLSGSLDITSTTDLRDINTEISNTVDDLVVVMGLLSVLIGGIGIVNTMLVIVSRRTTEVAVLKTLGLEPREVIVLFLVEAILMGIIGSLLGILGGWVLAYAVKGIAEAFLGQNLAFTIALIPAVNGFVVGIIITAIFGFLPTLAAGQIRPANVLRPNETIIPRTGRLSAFAAIMVLVLALSLVAQGLLAGVLGNPEITSGLRLKDITTGLGAFYGLLIAVPLVLNGYLSMRERRRGRSWLLQLLRWLGTLVIVPVLGGLFGYYVPAIVILTLTVILIGYLYIALWMVIWAVGGGRFREVFPGILVLLFPLFWPLIPVLIVLIIPTWVLGRLIQRFTFVDLKLAMRSMLATKGRGASTLVALVVGVFTLSLITMMVDTITQTFQNLLEDVAGGNILVLSAGGEQTMGDVRAVFEENPDYVRSYAVIANYNSRLTQYYDVSTRRESRSGSWWFDSIDGREISSNLPDLNFIAGRNLDPALDSAPDADGYWSMVAVTPQGDQGERSPVDLGVGDTLVFSLTGKEVKFRIVGIAEQGLSISNSNLYAPLAAFDGFEADSTFAIADVKEDHIKDIRRSLAKVPGVFVLETRLINDLVNRVIGQFTSFPILVAALALVTGGVVIANAVALSTLERRREIGVMKAIGLQRERVLGMLLLENGLMGIVGGLIGVGISFVGLVISLSSSELGDNTAIPYVTAFSLMGLCILISLGAALLSVWGASGEKPLNVLRYE